jgi:hypothetical protein
MPVTPEEQARRDEINQDYLRGLKKIETEKARKPLEPLYTPETQISSVQLEKISATSKAAIKERVDGKETIITPVVDEATLAFKTKAMIIMGTHQNLSERGVQPTKAQTIELERTLQNINKLDSIGIKLNIPMDKFSIAKETQTKLSQQGKGLG